MEKKKKKRVLKRRRSKKKKTSKKKPSVVRSVPSQEERELEAEVMEHTNEPYNPLSGVQRLNSTPDYTKTLQRDIISKVYAKYQAMSVAQLKYQLKDPNNTILEITAISQSLRLIKGDRVALSTAKYIHDRIDGKPKERIEHSGPGGGPIETRDNTVFDVANMSKVERQKLRKHLLALKKLPTTTQDEDETDS